jgi:hypothetical protein
MSNDDVKDLLLEIRDMQREQLELLRANINEANEVNRLALENHSKWNSQNARQGKWTAIFLVLAVVILGILTWFQRHRPQKDSDVEGYLRSNNASFEIAVYRPERPPCVSLGRSPGCSRHVAIAPKGRDMNDTL